MEDRLLFSFHGEMPHRKGRIRLHKCALGDADFLGTDAPQSHSDPFAFGEADKFCRREYSFDTHGFQVNDPIGKPGQIGQPVFGNQHRYGYQPGKRLDIFGGHSVLLDLC